MTAKRKRDTPRAAETYRGATRNLARAERNKRGPDKREARAARKAYAEYVEEGGVTLTEFKGELGFA